MDPVKCYYFISRFLDSDIPTVTTNFKEFLVKDGVIQMLVKFITQNYPKEVVEELKNNPPPQNTPALLALQQKGPDLTEEELSALSIEERSNFKNKKNVSVELIKSYKVMNLFLHPSPPFISLAKDKLPVIVSTLFEFFESENNGIINYDENSLPNIHHFSKVLSSLFYQFTFDFLNQLSEIQPSSQKMYFQILVEHIYLTPIQELFLVIAKRASASVNEYQTSNPIETKKIQKTLQKSKVFSLISSFFVQPGKYILIINLKTEKVNLILEGIVEFVIKSIEALDIHGPDAGFTISSFQNKEFVDSLIKIMLNEPKKKDSFQLRKQCLSIINSLCKQSIEYSQKNQYQQEKESIFSPSGSPSSWVFYLTTNHLPNVCKILIDIGNDPNQKKTLGSYRMDMFNILMELIKAKATFKRKTPNQPYLPVELWYFLVEWFFQFNNIYHAKFFYLVKELFSQGHLPSIKHFCTNHLNRFITFYLDNEQSECKGVILILLNYIRISASQFPANHFLPTYLKSNDQWNSLYNTLITNTIKQYVLPWGSDDNQFNSPSNIDKIDFGSDFADSIGFGDETITASTQNKKLLIDTEFTGSSNNNQNNSNNNNNNNLDSIPMVSDEERAKLEEELLKDEANKKKKKNNNQKKKK
ncbi:hypothetical protein DICPUDRAFT_57580 [Dictyostelium purpureum]|uniref:Uncharacterized protein n=1 Tax=Dictyostelium purpureum TaxID=5786 RepID=F0ZWN0_DICPU|nr:uncharacterized protein DICPUDRAFT_57580 [Dictyostelium purpureum]EGC31652.1 hypothetical protein DICPUDRAFT_57580 [Dictyostelium purpureum]|eukprot:XP_003291818.1 hypothetical protein DICPUDRAFT_57580 [Dictyostelium purpureum]